MSAVAVVTGGAGALGRAIARRLARDGMALLLVDRDEGVHEAADALDGLARACVADLADERGTDVVIAAVRELGGPRVLVNNAGINRDARALEMGAEDFAAVVRVDLVAPARLAQALEPQLEDGGAIVNIASRAALGNVGQANYVAAKAGLVGLTRALALRLAPRLRVNAVAPGLVDTTMTAAMPPHVLDKLVARIPAGRMATPDEIAEVVGFVASPAAAYVTGQVLLACGGRSVAP